MELMNVLWVLFGASLGLPLGILGAYFLSIHQDNTKDGIKDQKETECVVVNSPTSKIRKVKSKQKDSK